MPLPQMREFHNIKKEIKDEGILKWIFFSVSLLNCEHSKMWKTWKFTRYRTLYKLRDIFCAGFHEHTVKCSADRIQNAVVRQVRFA